MQPHLQYYNLKSNSNYVLIIFSVICIPLQVIREFAGVISHHPRNTKMFKSSCELLVFIQNPEVRLQKQKYVEPGYIKLYEDTAMQFDWVLLSFTSFTKDNL
jgi:hypothetical protein